MVDQEGFGFRDALANREGIAYRPHTLTEVSAGTWEWDNIDGSHQIAGEPPREVTTVHYLQAQVRGHEKVLSELEVQSAREREAYEQSGRDETYLTHLTSLDNTINGVRQSLASLQTQLDVASSGNVKEKWFDRKKPAQEGASGTQDIPVVEGVQSTPLQKKFRASQREDS